MEVVYTEAAVNGPTSVSYHRGATSRSTLQEKAGARDLCEDGARERTAAMGSGLLPTGDRVDIHFENVSFITAKRFSKGIYLFVIRFLSKWCEEKEFVIESRPEMFFVPFTSSITSL